MKTVSKDTWHYWLFITWHRIFGESDTVSRLTSRGTNICHYLRVLLFWLPLTVSLTLGLLWVILSVAFEASQQGWLAFGMVVLCTTALALVVVSIVGSIIWTSRKMETEGTFLNLTKEWMKAKKASMCTLIEFK
jgi:hypothetical protein